jgi:single-stranded-DNA-specific exonuclease
LSEARRQIGEHGWGDAAAIVLGSAGWNHGIVGIVAGRLAEEHERPVVVIGFDEHGVGRGSVRGPRGFPLFDAVAAVSSLLERFGGHHAAAGLEVRLPRLTELREAFTVACGRLTPHTVDESPIFPLAAEDAAARVVRDLERLEPFGEQNPAPRFRVTGTVIQAKEVRGGHLKLELRRDNGERMGGFGAGLGPAATTLHGPTTLTGSLRWDRWRGGATVELGIERVEAGP